jgi:hypothetical protein
MAVPRQDIVDDVRDLVGNKGAEERVEQAPPFITFGAAIFLKNPNNQILLSGHGYFHSPAIKESSSIEPYC